MPVCIQSAQIFFCPVFHPQKRCLCKINDQIIARNVDRLRCVLRFQEICKLRKSAAVHIVGSLLPVFSYDDHIAHTQRVSAESFRSLIGIQHFKERIQFFLCGAALHLAPVCCIYKIIVRYAEIGILVVRKGLPTQIPVLTAGFHLIYFKFWL